MHQSKSKKIVLYIFLFLIIGTFNNKNSNNINFPNIKKVEIIGLDDKANYELRQKLSFLKIYNLFSIDEAEIKDEISTNNLIESYSVFKKYPKNLEIEIKKTEFLAYVKKGDNTFFLGSNGKLINTKKTDLKLPIIFGNFEIDNFFELKQIIDKTSFDYKSIENLFFFKSGRWDIETFSGILIRLPNERLGESLKLVMKIMEEKDFGSFQEIDLRQRDQLITNG